MYNMAEIQPKTKYIQFTMTYREHEAQYETCESLRFFNKYLLKKC